MPPLRNDVSRRLFFHVGGYDPKTPDAFFDRLDKELRRYETTWNVEAGRGPAETVTDGMSRATVTASGPSADGPWRVETDVVFLSLEDIVQRDFADPPTARAARYARAFVDYWTSGTAPKFFRHAWRFSLYFLYPALALAGPLALVALAAFLAVDAIVPDVPPALGTPVPRALNGAAVVLALVLAAPLVIRWVGRRGYVLHLADLWSFSSNWLHRRRPDADAIFRRYGETAARLAQSRPYDEVVFLGHSTGGAVILHVAAEALAADPDLRSRARHMNVLTVGSTALKIGLHPKAAWFRDEVRSLRDAGLGWVEYQSIQDIINFEGTAPAALMGLETEDPWPVTRRVRMKSTVEPETWARIRRNVFRVHYQFVFANTAPYHYDYASVAFGPLPLQARAEHWPDVTAHLGAEQ